ncbi:amidohydrolase family protein [Haliea sp.]|uniref:N-acyl-D-amino-acid deacylase family protein n=1 Tax=Haliea sp. TaxID=1932666 RepID=UPI0025B99110|nr:amidohydrolase family protein [Haliea sp.]|tara:strand:- start:37761 stop:39461 length:1701 start_codon:yes stop_codon:yes gene_type:complete
MYQLKISNALVCDGTGSPAYRGDVAIHDGKIVAVGTRLAGDAATVIDAQGLVLAPGFIDSHTHFDAQITWDGLATPSLEHGVTTVINGNCSLTMAPVRAEHRAFVGAVFRQIEEMPAAAFDAGMRWNWETFEDYLASFRDALGINVATLAGHSMLRLWVMGDAARERCASAAEIADMQQLLRQCLQAGAIGMSTSWVDIDHEHRPVPCRLAAPEELDALCAVLGEHGAVMQVVPEFWDPDLLCTRIDILGDLSRRHAITVTFSPLFDSNATPDLVPRALERVRLQVAHGARVVPQMQTRPIDVTFEFDVPTSVFSSRPTWWATILKPAAETLRDFQDPDVRRQLVDEAYSGMHPIAMEVHFPEFVVSRCHLPGNKPLEGRRLKDIAAERGCDPVELMLDLAVEESLQTRFSAVSVGHNNLERIAGPISDPLVQVGSGDGGAHVTRFATYGDTGYLFSRFVRDAAALTLEQAVFKLTGQIADNWGLQDRGRIRPGLAADLVIFDPDRIDRGPEIAVEDLPGEGYRYLRRALGVEQVFVNGSAVYSAQQGYTDARSGQLVSGRARRAA